MRRAVFEAIYQGKKKIKTVDELMQATGLGRVPVLNEGKKLAGNQIVTQLKVNGRTAYEKDEFFVHQKKKVLALVDDPSKRARYRQSRSRASKGRRLFRYGLGVRSRSRNRSRLMTSSRSRR